MVKESKKENIADNVMFRQEFLVWAQRYFKNPLARGTSTLLNRKDAKIERNTFTYRRINHWYEEGLIDDVRESNEWRRVSKMDLLWLNIIHELRLWGLSLNAIKDVKQSLSSFSKEVNLTMPLLEFCTVLALTDKVPIYLIIFKDGSCAPITYYDYKLNISTGIPDHISVNVNRIVQRLYPESDLSPFFVSDFHLTPEQIALFEFIESSNYEKITVTYKNGKMDLLEGLERVDASKKLVEVLKENKYQKIECNVQDGKTVSIVREIKKKVSHD